MHPPEYFADGFLGLELQTVKTIVLETHHHWHALFVSTNRSAVQLQFQAQITRESARELIAATAFSRTLATVQSSVRLLELGLLSQARALLRTALEAMFFLAAARASAAFAVTLAASEEAEKRSLLDKLKQWSDLEGQNTFLEALNDEVLKSLAESKTREVKVFEVARVAGMLNWYFSLYSLLSYDAHTTITSLQRYLHRDNQGNVTDLKNEPHIEGQEETWSYAVEILIRASEQFASVFGLSYGHGAMAREQLKLLAAKIAA